MELEQKPDSCLYPDEHATLYLDHTIAHIKIDNSHVSSLLKDIIMISANNNILRPKKYTANNNNT